jgi:alpha-tubulin suppressor-like RCC1 family protein
MREYSPAKPLSAAALAVALFVIGGGMLAGCGTPTVTAALDDRVSPPDAPGDVTDAPGDVTDDPEPADDVPPDTSIDGGPSGTVAVPTADFTFSGTDNVGVTAFECALDGAAWTECTSPAGLSGIADGEHTFAVRAVDAAGNVDDTPAERSWIVDTTVPVVAPQTFLDDGPTAGGSVLLDFATLTFSCDQAGCTFQCRIDGGSWVDCSSPWNLNGLSDGSRAFAVRAGISGVYDATPASRTWTVATADGGEHDWSVISVGRTHACGIDSDGALFCWGTGTYGSEMGQGTSGTSYDKPMRVGGESDWTAIATGFNFTCGIRAGTLWCWGKSTNGPLGLGATTEALTPAQVGSATDWLRIDAGNEHVCGVRGDNTLWCWGYNNNGQLGDASLDNRTTPVQIGAAIWSRVSAGDAHTCAVSTASRLYCWGLNDGGRLGDGTVTQRTSPTEVSGALTTWTDVSAGGAHTCGLKNDSTLWCWGANGEGQVGIAAPADQHTPVSPSGMTSWATVAAGGAFTCATTSLGELWCWGAGGSGQLARGSRAPSTVPLYITAGIPKVSAGSWTACGIGNDGAGACWGTWAGSAFLGNPTISAQPNPRRVGWQSDWQSASTNGQTSCAVRGTADDLYCWGDNTSGDLGIGSVITHGLPQFVAGGAMAASAGGCYINASGEMYCWGLNANGFVGDGSEVSRTSLVRIGSERAWKSVARGSGHSCAISVAGELWCWGYNNGGRVGDGSVTQKILLPVRIGSESDWTGVAPGASHTCGVRGGELWCWGDNAFGQLGTGVFGGQALSPARVGSASDWTDVWSGDGANANCARRSGGSVWCWGENTYGQLGLGDKDNRNEPTQLATSDWSLISMAYKTACGVRGDGELFCWGDNTYGQLGLGHFNERTTPDRIGGAADWIHVDVGGETACGVKGTGYLYCWGRNMGGELGLGRPLAPGLIAEP